MKLFKFFLKLDFFTIAVCAFLLYIVVIIMIVYLNHFSKTITIKEKYNYGFGKSLSNVVMDTNGEVFTVHNMPLILYYDALYKYSSLDVGKTYHVSGYGIAIPFLNMYPNITKISPA